MVVVTFVKMAVEGEEAPMVVPLIVPPPIVTLLELRFVPVRFNAVSVVPDAVTKPSQTVEVTAVAVAFVIVTF